MDKHNEAIIDSFVADFISKKESYETLCNIAKHRIREVLKQKGIMALVTARVKDPDRLKEKLSQRNAERPKKGHLPYQDFEDIYNDIPDLVGVRIALYFPGDGPKVKDILSPHFSMIEAKDFPEKIDDFDKLYKSGFTAYKRRIYSGYDERKFDGYCAIHHRVKFSTSPINGLEKVMIEIQVATILMHAWSEVEHDLAYKKKMGDVSREEYECLDEINGLVMAGEIALSRLNQLSQQRIRNSSAFETHYTLAIHIEDWRKHHNIENIPLGNVEALYQIYKQSNHLSYGDVDKQLGALERQGIRKNEPLADQLIDIFAEADHRTIVKNVMSQSIIETNGLDDNATLYSKFVLFLSKWNALEDRIKKALRGLGYVKFTRIEILQLIERQFVLTEEFAKKYQLLRKTRNQVVHGQVLPTKIELENLISEIESLSTWLDDFFNNQP